jgi:catalase
MAEDNYTTTTAGNPVASDDHSLTVGPDGPIVLHDHYLIEKIAQFNRERVPERQPHAKGGGAFGQLEITHDVSAFTTADMFQPGRTTETLVRFSPVAGERGYPDTYRDLRGFAIKFYTSDGNYDLVGNNTPVFFLRDPMKFQDFIRSQKRRADNDLRDADMQWDFWTLSPESAHQVAWLMGDRGIPRTWRHMDGFSSHTYLWVNAAGERFWVRYHFKTDQGIEWFTQEQADQMVATDADYHRRDLFDAIERGDHPSWSLKMQIMPFEAAKSYRFNPFDLTKVISQKDYPLIPVGRMTLDRNPSDFHTEIEQAAFEPSNMVPGIGPSPDKMLLGRMFAYPDAHRYRIGTNYNELPVNAPRAAPVRTYAKDGHMRRHNPGDPVYAPNSKGGPQADADRFGEAAGWHADGDLQHAASTLHAEDDDWGQAHTLVRRVMDEAARERLVDNVARDLLGGVSEPVLQRAFGFWRRIDDQVGRRIESRVRAAQDERAGTFGGRLSA